MEAPRFRFDLPCILFQALFLAGLAALVLTPIPARADIGPKPTVDFEFIQNQDPPLIIVGGVLLECSDPACADARPLKELGPQRFTCKNTSCSALGYGFSDYLQLRVEFSDGVTRQSNVFTKRHFNAAYRVTVGENDLAVRETGSTSEGLALLPMMMLGSPILLGLCGLASVGLLGVTIAFAIRGGRAQLEYRGAKWLYFLAWSVGLIALAAGAVVSWAVPLTILVEEILAFGYASWHMKDRLAVLTAALLANLLTLPAFILLTAAGLIPSTGVQLIGEALIWLVEAAILCLVLRRSISFWQALVLSLIMNMASFVLGLTLPV